MSNGYWQDGYWVGPLKDGYPPSYFDENDTFSYPWEKDLPKQKDETNEHEEN